MLVSCPQQHVGIVALWKKLRIRRGCESQASAVVVVSSGPTVQRMASVVDSSQVHVERIGSHVVGFTMGRFAAIDGG